jgi:thymidine kinase
MAKLYFYYSAMNAGKTTTLLQSSYNYQERGLTTLLFKPLIDTRDGVGKISSRIGLSESAIQFPTDFDFFKFMERRLQSDKPKVDCILLDEAHFLTKDQVYQLSLICDVHKVPVLTYGLRSDFQGELFEGSKYLLAWAEELVEIKTICHCGRKATMNMRVDTDGRTVRDGEQIEIGGNERYLSVCRKHFHEGICEETIVAPTQKVGLV